MRYIVAIVGILSLLGLSTASGDQNGGQPAGPAYCTLKVAGMACNACAARVEKTARKIAGVTAAKARQPKGLAEITYDPAKTTPEAIAKIVADKTGFKAEVAPRGRD